MKKVISLVLVIALCFALAACGTPANNTPSNNSGNTTPEEKTVTLKLSSNIPEAEFKENSTGMARGLNTWIETVEKESNGTIKIQAYFGAQLASGTQAVVTGCQTNAFEVAHLSTGNFSTYTDAFAELNVPFLFTNFEDTRTVLAGEIGKDMMAKFEKDVNGLKALSYFAIGFRQITNNNKEIHTPADMAGLKIRTMDDKYQIAAMTALGAAVTPLSINELYSGLQTHLVDAQENPLSTIYNNKFYEVQKYCSLSNHSFTVSFIFMNQNVYNSLSDNQKAAIDKANAACIGASIDQAAAADGIFQEKLEKEGNMVFTKLTADEAAQFQDACKSAVWTEVQKAIGDARWTKLVNALGIK